jgi:hypothetical protein
MIEGERRHHQKLAMEDLARFRRFLTKLIPTLDTMKLLTWPFLVRLGQGI